MPDQRRTTTELGTADIDDKLQSASKRVRPSDIDIRGGQKKRKPVAATTMPASLSPFETPHPTLETQSQVFKLPSSKPQHSPTPLSPVPNTTSRTLQTQQHSHGALPSTSSRNLKENPSSGKTHKSWTPWPSARSHQSSRTLPSMTPTSDSALPVANQIQSGTRTWSRSRRHSRSNSRSSNSNSNSSRASSKESHKSNPKYPKSKQLPNPNSKPPPKFDRRKLDLLNPPQSKSKSKSKAQSKLIPSSNSNSRPHLKISASSPTVATLLASPFVSRASSPTELGKAHIRSQNKDSTMGPPLHPPLPSSNTNQNSNRYKKRTLADTFFDPNQPPSGRGRLSLTHHENSKSHSKRHHGVSQSLSTNVSPERAESGSRSRPDSKSRDGTSGSKSRRRARGGQENQPRSGGRGKDGDRGKREGEEAGGALAWKDRRPSAPSSLLRPRPQPRPLNLARASAAANSRAKLEEEGGEEKRGHGHEQTKANNNVHEAAPPLALAFALDTAAVPVSATAAHLLAATSTTQANDAEGHDGRSTLRSTSTSASTFARGAQAYDSDAGDAYSWMRARAGVDFNRPPSQMSAMHGFGFEYPEVEAEDAGVFWSSSSESEEEGEEEGRDGGEQAEGVHDEKSRKSGQAARRPRSALDDAVDLGLDLNLGFGFGTGFNLNAFGADTWGASTPFRDQSQMGAIVGAGGGNGKTIARTQSLPSLASSRKPAGSAEGKDGVNMRMRTWSVASGEGEDEDEDMELTAPLLVGVPAEAGGGERDGWEQGGGEEEDGDQEYEEKEDEEDMDEAEEEDEKQVLRAINRKETRRKSYLSWITDSIISSPSGYIRREKDSETEDGGNDGGYQEEESRADEEEEEQKEGEEEHTLSSILSEIQPRPQPQSQQRLSSPFRLDYGNSTTSSSSDMGVDIDMGTNAATTAEKEEQAANENNCNEKDATKAMKANAKRTRSGTIVPAKPINPGIAIGIGDVGAARRTRSGTIIGPLPDGPGNGGGSRRSRSGTILASNAVPSLNGVQGGVGGVGLAEGGGHRSMRTRSGTIVASGPSRMSTTAPGIAAVGRRTRSGSVMGAGPSAINVNGNGKAKDKGSACQPVDDEPEVGASERNASAGGGGGVDDAVGGGTELGEVPLHDNMQQECAEADAEVADVEGYTDSLYLPRLTSSPDPIDFLRFARIIEDDEGEGELDEAQGAACDQAVGGNLREMVWCVSDEPPSPEVLRRRKGGGGRGWKGVRGGILLGPRGRGGKTKAGSTAKGACGGGKAKAKARFAGVGGDGEGGEDEENAEGENGGEEMSDDELLLVGGSTMELWG